MLVPRFVVGHKQAQEDWLEGLPRDTRVYMEIMLGISSFSMQVLNGSLTIYISAVG